MIVCVCVDEQLRKEVLDCRVREEFWVDYWMTMWYCPRAEYRKSGKKVVDVIKVQKR